jgi:putative transposase
MRIIDPQTGEPYFAKRRRRNNDADEPRELTFSCYRGFAFFERERTREWFREALEAARAKFGFQIWAYVVMPEHIHLVVYPGAVASDPRPSKTQGVPHGNADFSPRPSKTQGAPHAVASHPRRSKTQGVPPGEQAKSEGDERMSRFLQAVKEPVARKAIAHLKATAPDWLDRLTVREGRRVRLRFWQPGGGYDRNVTSNLTLRAMVEYIHANPVRRGLVSRIEDWEWSSARWYAGMRPVNIDMDCEVLAELQSD